MMRIVAEPEAMARLEASIKESPMGEVRVPVRIANPFDTARYWETAESGLQFPLPLGDGRIGAPVPSPSGRGLG